MVSTDVKSIKVVFLLKVVVSLTTIVVAVVSTASDLVGCGYLPCCNRNNNIAIVVRIVILFNPVVIR
jgi:hypothetical protein